MLHFLWSGSLTIPCAKTQHKPRREKVDVILIRRRMS
jgi:hypothetical protein